MDLRALVDRIRGKQQERLVREGLHEQALGGDDVFLTPGADHGIESYAARAEHIEEHEQPE
ncbi:MAG: hypothetical protein JOZ56_08570 [Actinobacteria bacterium]|nr:hypothetical protein [Actinomycetota bacterium]MBV8563130.1 hypothetical protein [Actinomycetota bacterium]